MYGYSNLFTNLPLLLIGVDLPLDLMSVHRNPAVLDPERDCLRVAKHFKYGLWYPAWFCVTVRADQGEDRPESSTFCDWRIAAYIKSSKKVFGKKTNHIRHIHIAGKRDRDNNNNNNKMERLNGEIRDREKVFRGLKKFDTPLIDGMKAYYNYTKKHGSLKGRTPAEEALIEVDGKNKWITLIQNASLHKENSV